MKLANEIDDLLLRELDGGLSHKLICGIVAARLGRFIALYPEDSQKIIEIVNDLLNKEQA